MAQRARVAESWVMVLLKLMYLNICKGHGETSEGEKVKRIEYSRKGQGPQMVANEMRKRRSTQGESLGGGAELGCKSRVP